MTREYRSHIHSTETDSALQRQKAVSGFFCKVGRYCILPLHGNTVRYIQVKQKQIEQHTRSKTYTYAELHKIWSDTLYRSAYNTH